MKRECRFEGGGFGQGCWEHTPLCLSVSALEHRALVGACLPLPSLNPSISQLPRFVSSLYSEITNWLITRLLPMAVAQNCAFLVPGMEKGRKPVPLRGDGRASPLLPASLLRSARLPPRLAPRRALPSSWQLGRLPGPIQVVPLQTY